MEGLPETKRARRQKQKQYNFAITIVCSVCVRVCLFCFFLCYYVVYNVRILINSQLPPNCYIYVTFWPLNQGGVALFLHIIWWCNWSLNIQARVFFGSDFIVVIKSEGVSWYFLKPENLAAVMSFYSSGLPLFLYLAAAVAKHCAPNILLPATNSICFVLLPASSNVQGH